jgi:hypothetical protein
MLGLRSSILTVSALVVSLLLVACGDDDRLSAEDYRAEFSSLSEEQGRAIRDLNQAFHSESVVEIRAGLEAFAQNQDSLGDTVDDLEAPEDAESANEQLASAAHQRADEIRAVADELSGVTDPNEAVELVNERLENSEGTQAFDDALSELNRLGYTESG